MAVLENNVIAIVGPSGSGKSTVGYIVAVRLGYRYLDVGKIWRIIGAKIVQNGQTPDNERACLAVADALVEAAKRLGAAANRDDLLADHLVEMMGATPGQLVQRGVGQATARSTVHISVRRAVAEAVRALYGESGTIVVGRPFTYTEVFPDAYLKVLIYGKEKLRAALKMEEETPAEVAERDRLDGLEVITMQELAEVDAAYNVGTWETVDLARAIATLAWQRSPVSMSLKLNAL